MLFVLARDLPGKLADVAHDPHGHPGVGAALELDEDVDPQPATADPDAPDQIVMQLPAGFGHIAAIDPVEGGEIDFFEPLARHVADEQVAHHLGTGKEALVGGVGAVVHVRIMHGKLSPRNIFS